MLFRFFILVVLNLITFSVKAEIKIQNLRSGNIGKESPSLLKQVKDARTDKITAEYRLKEKKNMKNMLLKPIVNKKNMLK